MKEALVFLASFLGVVAGVVFVDYLSIFEEDPLVFSLVLGLVVVVILLTIVKKGSKRNDLV